MDNIKWYSKRVGDTVFVEVFTNGRKNGTLDYTQEDWAKTYARLSGVVTFVKDDTISR